MKDRLIPNSDFYRIREPISLERECAERFIQILNTDIVQHTAVLPDQTQSFYTSQTFEPDEEQSVDSKESIPLLRISQTLTIPASADLNLKSGDIGNLTNTTDEYHVLSLEMGDWSDEPDYENELDEQMGSFDIDWRGEIAVIIKPPSADDQLEIHIVNQQTGASLTTEQLLELLSLLSAWQEEQRYNGLIDDLRSMPSITNRSDSYLPKDLSYSFSPSDYIVGLSCHKCSLEQIPCNHSGFRHNAN